MEAINIIIALTTIIAAFAFCVGIIKMLFKKQRATGKRIALFSFIAMIVAIAGLTKSVPILDEQAVEAGYKNYAEQQNAERQKNTTFENEAPLKALNGFPDEETLETAQSKGVTRYEAYRLLSDRNTIARFCAYNTEGHAIEKAKHAEMDKTSNEAKQTEIWDKYEIQQKQLLSKFNTELGLQGYELTNLSISGNWLSYCRAAEENWSVLTGQHAKDATRADANEAEEALNAFYLWNLKNQKSTFFSAERYSAVSCTWHNYKSKRLVGCQLISISYESKWQMFVVGRLDNGNLAVSPINGDTSGKLHSAAARFYDQTEDKHIFVQAYEQPRAYLAHYAGPMIDISAVQKLFE